MSVVALTWAWRQAPKNAQAKLVLAALADAANDQGVCWFYRKSLAEKCAPMGLSALDNALRALQEGGLLLREQTHDDGGGFGYTVFTLPIDTPIDRSANHRSAKRRNGKSPIGETAERSNGGTVTPIYEPIYDGNAKALPYDDLGEWGMLLSDSGEEAAVPTGSDFCAFFVDESRRVNGVDPIGSDTARIGRDSKKLLREGVSEEAVRAAITELLESGLTVGALKSLAGQAARGGFRGFKRGPRVGRGVTGGDLDDAIARLEAAGR